MPRIEKPNFRVAMRAEGDNWNCYFAKLDTMEGAVVVGSLSMGLAEHPEIRERFIELMKRAVELAGGDMVGIRPAPEHERVGRG